MALNELRAVDKWLSIVGVVLLAVYFVLAVYALSSPSDDPQQGTVGDSLAWHGAG